jgi:Holliday junction resolvase RusA-like endonuclease
MQKKHIIHPVLMLPTDLSRQTTAPLEISTQDTIPVRALPPAVEISPFFRGVMPLPPSVNSAYKIVNFTTNDGRQVHRIGPGAELDQFKQDAALLLAGHVRSSVNWTVLNALRASPRKTPLSVRIQAYFASEWRRDLDGIIKHAVDACFAFLHLNDNQVVKLEAEKLVDAKDPRVEIAVAVLVGRR